MFSLLWVFFLLLVIRKPSQVVGKQQKFGTGPTGFRIAVSCWDGYRFYGIMKICPLKTPEMGAVWQGRRHELLKFESFGT